MPMAVIDADGHIAEPEAMFAELPKEFYPRRPIPVLLPRDTVRGDFNGCWIIEGKTFPTIGARGRTTFSMPGDERFKVSGVSAESQTLSEVPRRLADLDRFEIDTQVIFPTMFLVSAAEDVKLEGALFQAYNSYLARASAESKGRLGWAAPLPFRDPEAAIEEMRRVSQLGAAGIFTMGMVWDRTLDDPLFFPVYEEAQKLDLPICVHLGWASPPVTNLFSDGRAFFCSATIPVIWGFFSIMSSGLLTRFPGLRVGFLETGSMWVPYAIHQLRRRVRPPSVLRGQAGRPQAASGVALDYYRDPEEFFRTGRAFVNCEGDEDFRFLLDHLGEDALMCSSDFPHGDASAEETFVSNWRRRSEMPERIRAKLLGENAARFFRL
jgi:predicted TIM-barrel fold metal-dependent hydrolase